MEPGKKGRREEKAASLGIVFHVLDANKDTLYDVILTSEENRATNVTKTNVERSWFFLQLLSAAVVKSIQEETLVEVVRSSCRSESLENDPGD